MAGRHRRSRRRAQPERRERAAEGAGGAAAAHALPAGLERRGTASRHHPLPHPRASRFGFETKRSWRRRCAPRSRAMATRSTRRRSDGARAQRGKRAAGARARLERAASNSIARSLADLGRPARYRWPRGASLVDRLARLSRQRAARSLSLASAWADRAADPLHRYGEGATAEERKLAPGSFRPRISPHWAEAWEAISEAKAEAYALNLDRSLLLLRDLVPAAARGAGTSCLARPRARLPGPHRQAIPAAMADQRPTTSPLPSPTRTTRPISAMPMRPSRPMRSRASAACRATTFSS